MKTNTKTPVRKSVVPVRPQGRVPRSTPRRRSVVLSAAAMAKLKESIEKAPIRRTTSVTRRDDGRRPDLPRTGFEPKLGEADVDIVGTVVLQFGYHLPHSSYSTMLEKSEQAKIPILSDRKDFHHDKKKAVTGKQVIFIKELNAVGILEQLETAGFVLRGVTYFIKADQTVVFEVTFSRELVPGKKKPTKRALEFVRKQLLPNIYYFVVVWQNPESSSGPASVNFTFSSGNWSAKKPAAQLYREGPLFKARRITAQ